jgi:hypothetical protein
MKSQNGFATVLLMTLLPALLAFAVATFFTFSMLKQDLGTLNVCRAFELNMQNKVGGILKKLLGLNPKALRLRASEQRAQRRLVIAMQSGNPAAIAAAEGVLLAVQTQRGILDFQQKALIASANSLLKTGGAQGLQAVEREWQSHQKPMNSWLKASLFMKTPQVPQLSVLPDLPEVAPAYKPAPDFETSQTWLQSWTVRLQGKDSFQAFLKFAANFERSCSTSLYPEGAQWIAKLKTDTAKVTGNDGTKKAKSWSKDFY